MRAPLEILLEEAALYTGVDVASMRSDARFGGIREARRLFVCAARAENHLLKVIGAALNRSEPWAHGICTRSNNARNARGIAHIRAAAGERYATALGWLYPYRKKA